MVEVSHAAVLKEEVFSLLEPQRRKGLVIDATLGEGGHAELFLARRPDMALIGLDADESILDVARERLSRYAGRVTYYHAWFNHFFDNYPEGLETPDTVLFDLGISSFHYEKSERGFSFLRDEPLDMRLDTSLELSAEDVINDYPVWELADLLFEYGEERYSRRIARGIADARRESRIQSSARLAEVIANSVPPAYRNGRIHPATRSFQALRIAVNGELPRLAHALEGALQLLRIEGRLGVIAFHSLEDRIVKHFFQEKSKSCTCPPEWPICKCGAKPIVEILTKKLVRPEEDEVLGNPASRSARLRVVRKMRTYER